MESSSLLGNMSNNTEKQNKNATESLFSGLSSLISLLPTGTVFLFQFLNPVATNSGVCQPFHKYLSAAFLTVCSFNCCFATFTDSYTGSDGRRHYGVATTKGLWPAPSSESMDLSAYRLRVRDFVHALLSLGVFGVLGFLDKNTVNCLYPEMDAYNDILLKALPPIMGLVSGTFFSIFPWKRHGIGYYPVTDTSKNGISVS
ncbi:protein DMP2-like [Prosopis cineraria]|uniref:protein DMP2-like n=1 Tax=Prosopis cineraria TaxID=364024 RepID=UPI00240F51C3|nr:protein DMP2-like [Prosopis cineraria]